MQLAYFVFSVLSFFLWPLTVAIQLINFKADAIGLSYALVLSQWKVSELQDALEKLVQESVVSAQGLFTMAQDLAEEKQICIQLINARVGLRAALAAAVKKGADDVAKALKTLDEAEIRVMNAIAAHGKTIAAKNAIIGEQARRLNIADGSKGQLLMELDAAKGEAKLGKKRADDAIQKLKEQLAAKDAALQAQATRLADMSTAADAANTAHAAALLLAHKISTAADAATMAEQDTKIRALLSKATSTVRDAETRKVADAKTTQIARICELDATVGKLKSEAAEALASKLAQDVKTTANTTRIRKQENNISGLNGKIKKMETEAVKAAAEAALYKVKSEKIIKVVEQRAREAEERVRELHDAAAKALQDSVNAEEPPAEDAIGEFVDGEVDMAGSAAEYVPVQQPPILTRPWTFSPLFIVRSDSGFAQASISEPGCFIREGRKVVGRQSRPLRGQNTRRRVVRRTGGLRSASECFDDERVCHQEREDR
ncbi:hypothetical protein C8J57DRAFT_1238730 [Mycena rebaudengoi]|nr:hypothetical protein C8J57DRAFT_1238730 [Mycena rebaudengoi]